MPSLAVLFLAIFVILGLVRAAPSIPKPTITIDVANGKYASLGGIQPTLSWKTAGSTDEFGGTLDYEAGLNVVVEDLNKLPYNVWGRVKRSLGRGFNLGIAAKASSPSNFEDLSLDVTITGDDATLLQVTGQAFTSGVTNPVEKIQFHRALPVVGGGKLIVNPKYNFRTKDKDLFVYYAPSDGTRVGVETAAKKLTVSQTFPDKALTVKPSITPSRDFAVDVTKKFEKAGTTTISYKPATSVNLKWQDGPWVANLHAPMKSHLSFDGCDVSFKRKVDI
eukprot:CAMPEP_0194027200 /NCGR_PEP_ID=MMETSP0009_2-20130614/1382_1 /TAXON_ID=210454 /ORGANISM="Grammatophora oceanica, Strain CCMP 410" /LENGTH=277 /DNA_ID=CAMNT_0038666169 /DNA_START=39 /DNA_END=872 /DNA_ORIENTATION=-